jgi:hypothetical protein
MAKRAAPPKRQHYTVDMDMDMDEQARPITLDARSLTLPSVAVIAVVISSVALTYFIAEERSRIDSRIDTVVSSVERLAVSIQQLAEGLKFGASDRFTSTHFQLFCAKAEIQNKNWRCPPIGDLSSEPTRTLQGTLNSVEGEMGAIQKKLERVKPPEN